MTRPRIVYWNDQPTPYLVDRLNAVVANGLVEVEAWFETERHHDRSWKVDPSTWNFRGRYLSWTNVGGLRTPMPDERLLALRPDVVITPIDRKVAPTAVAVGRVIAGRVASRTLPSFETWVPPSLTTQSVYRLLYHAIDGAKVPGPDGVAFARKNGLPASRCWSVNQAIDLDLYTTAKDIPTDTRANGRRERGLTGCVFLYVGRLHHQKGVRHLLSAFRSVQESGIDASLLIVGDGSDERELRNLAAGLHGVHFEGFVQGAKLPEIYALGDVSVFPTLGDPNGLVVEEAMAAGLPVISTTNAGDIFLRINDGVNGFVVSAFDPQSMAAKMRCLAVDPGLREAMARQAQKTAASYSMKHYADDFDRFIEGLLDMAPRRNTATLATRALGHALIAAGRKVEPSQTVS